MYQDWLVSVLRRLQRSLMVVTEQELYKAVLEAYEGNVALMTEQAQLLWLRRKDDQLWNPPSL
jgi:hypothetical protein